MMLLLGIFASVAVGLAAVGLYGVLAYTVALRTRDIGIRMALGATRNAVARAIFANGLAMAVVGALAGLIAARLGVRLVSHTLYGVPETDPIVFIGAPVALVTVAVLACLIPVRRAVAVDPLTAIRAE
jgi:ABC-type antimicrobial peptide transport system permease subunit